MTRKLFVSMLLLAFCMDGKAQQSTIKFEAGLNYPIGLKQNGNKENKIGVYAAAMYGLNNSLNLHMQLSYESYTIVEEGFHNGWSNGRSFVLEPAITYNLVQGKSATLYTGLGAGLSIDNRNAGVFNKGNKAHFVFTPQVNVQLFRHLNIGAQYHISHKDLSRLMAHIGYTF